MLRNVACMVAFMEVQSRFDRIQKERKMRISFARCIAIAAIACLSSIMPARSQSAFEMLTSVQRWYDHTPRDNFEAVFGRCGNPCAIGPNLGGDVEEFQEAAKAALRTGREVIINYECDSACAVFADAARRNICVGPSARFGFHKTFVTIVAADWGKRLFPRQQIWRMWETRGIPPQSPWIHDWVRRHGGYPTVGVMYMYAGDARKFWRSCG